MKKVRKLFTIIMTVCLVFSTMGVVAYAGQGEDCVYEGEHMGDQWIVYPDGSREQVFCVNEGRNYKASNPQGTNNRVKYVWSESPDRHNAALGSNISNAFAFALTGNMYDSNGNEIPTGGYGGIGENQFTRDDVVTDLGPQCINLLKRVLYLGAPNNAQGDNFSGEETQEAVYWCIYNGKNNNSATGIHANSLVEKALALESVPEGEVYVYLITPEDFRLDRAGWDQCTINAKFTTQEDTSKTPTITNTTAKVNDNTGTVGLKSGEEGTMTDVVELADLEDGKTYTLVSTLYKDGKEFATATKEVTSADATCTVTFEKTITEAGEYSIKTELKDGDNVVAEHNGDLSIASETVNVTVEKPEAKMATTVSVDGEESSADAAVEVEEGEKDVVDTITYEGLTPGATYKVTGTLMDVTDGEPKEVANASAECVADESGNGTWEIVFKGAKLEAGKTYVVFEEAVNVEDADDCAEHKDANDLAQTIVVKESEDPPAEEETTPPPPEVPSTSLDDEPTADNKTPEKTEKTTTPSSNSTPTQSRTTAPRTGDETNIMLWVALVAIAGASTAGLVLKKKTVRNK